MPTIRLTLTRPHAAQRRVIDESRRFNVVACGRRWGKTEMGKQLAVQAALKGLPVGWWSPTYKMLIDVWRGLKDTLGPVTREVSAQEHRIYLITGGMIEMWSLGTIESTRGRKYGLAIIDEATMVKDLENAYSAVIRPTLVDLKGSLWMLSTPKGMNYFHTAYSRGQDKERSAWMSWRMPTTSNPFIDTQEVENERKETTERIFAQEFLAEFVDDSTGVFRGVYDAVDWGRTDNEAGAHGESYTVGVDLARKRNYTVITAIDSDGRQVYFDRINQASWERQIETILHASSLYPNATVNIDASGVGDPVVERLVQKGLRVNPIVFTASVRQNLLENLALLIEQGALSLMDVKTQTEELIAFEYADNRFGSVRMQAPDGMHDDCVMALALAAMDRGRMKPKWEF